MKATTGRLNYLCVNTQIIHEVFPSYKTSSCGLSFTSTPFVKLEPGSLCTCMGCVACPWFSEPDSVDFEYEGYRCALRRVDAGFWSGYVDLSERTFGRVSNEFAVTRDFVVHNGLSNIEWISSDSKNTNKADVVRIWFDCGHSDDMIPAVPALDGNPRRYGNYRTLDYAQSQLRQLASLIREIDSSPVI